MRLLLSVLIVMMFVTTTHAEMPRKALIEALIKVESQGDDHVVGDHHLEDKAYGPLQIRQPCVDDVNRRYGTNYRAQDCLGNRALSILICQRYIDMYATEKEIGRDPTDRDMARIWNGGPNGHTSRKTVSYWSKVSKKLNPKSTNQKSRK